MDTLNLTNSLRRDMITYVSNYLDNESMRWFRDTMSSINKRVMEVEDFQLHVNVFNIYSNFVNFFEKYSTEVTASGILYTMYSCAVQLELDIDNDRFINLNQIQELFDKDDISLLNIRDIKDFDVMNYIEVVRSVRGYSNDEDILACGLTTLSALSLI
jgi:hypothetical protein